MTLPPWPIMVGRMETPDTTAGGENGDAGPEGISQGVICFIEATGLFEAGQRVFIDPTSAYAVGHWLLVRPRGSPTSWVAWARLREDGTRMLDRTDGERLEYQEGRHEIRGVIAGVLVPPPVPESARR